MSASAAAREEQTEQPSLKLRWRLTWPGKDDHDFVAMDKRMRDAIVGRLILVDQDPVNGQWMWSLIAQGKDVRRPVDDRGYAKSAREAAARVEAAWFKSVEHIPLDAPAGSIR